MNVAVIKTKAEMALVEQFESVAAKLPGNAGVAQVRRQAIGQFAALGLPQIRTCTVRVGRIATGERERQAGPRAAHAHPA